MKPYLFRNGTAVLTGAASGIGLALARDLAARGSHLALIDRDAAGLERVAAGLRAAHPALTVSTHPFDLSDTAGIAELPGEVTKYHRRVTLLINNAGVALGGAFEQLTLEEFEWVQAINFRAVVAMCSAFLPPLRAHPGAQIVNVSSIYGILAPPGQSAYAASKFAVRGFSEALRHELAPQGIGVTVVHPGGVRTNIARSARVGSGVDEREVEAGRAAMNRALRLSPERAAETILTAARRRQPRVLVGSDARIADIVARLFPGHYWQLLQRVVPTRG